MSPKIRRVLSVYQLIAGITAFAYGLYLVLFGPGTVYIVVGGTTAAIAALTAIAGFLLGREYRSGWALSVLAQAITLPRIATNVISLRIVMGFDFTVAYFSGLAMLPGRSPMPRLAALASNPMSAAGSASVS